MFSRDNISADCRMLKRVNLAYGDQSLFCFFLFLVHSGPMRRGGEGKHWPGSWFHSKGCPQSTIHHPPHKYGLNLLKFINFSPLQKKKDSQIQFTEQYLVHGRSDCRK